MFHHAIQLFKHASVLFDEEVQSSSITGLQMISWVQLKKERGSWRLVLSDSESVAAFSDKFIVLPKFVVEHLKHLDVVDFEKKKRGEERAKESQKAKEKNYEDYAWKDLCEDPTELKKLRVPELNKYVHQAP